MATARRLQRNTEQTEFTVNVNGKPISREYHLMTLSVVHQSDKISYAKLVYLDGIPSKGDFPLSNQDLFIPGNEVEITAGGISSQATVFKGIITGHSIRIFGNTSSQLRIECRHKASKLTVSRKSAYFYHKKDSEIMVDTLSGNGFAEAEIDVEETDVTHKEMVQYYATDWDFLLSRAVANGKMIFTRNDQLQICKPKISSEAVVSLLHGATIYELDAEMESRYQYTDVKAQSWDPTTGMLAEMPGDASLSEQGNLSSSELAGAMGIDPLLLQHGGAVAETELKAWADASMLRSRFGKIRGKVQLDGITTILTGDTLELNGIGERFNGNVLVTGVRHDLDPAKGWKTTLQFGCKPDLMPADTNGIEDAPAAGLLPALNGLHIGIVISNEDPENENRVQVRMPLVSESEDGIWARVASPDAGNERGMFFRPEIGDEVILGFINDDPRDPVVLGMLNSSVRPAPLNASDENHEKGFVSRTKMKIVFNDQKKTIDIETPAGNKLLLSEEETSIILQDQSGNKIALTPEGIKIESIGSIEVKAASNFTLQAVNGELKADMQMNVQGNAGVELNSSGPTKIQGSLVQIN